MVVVLKEQGVKVKFVVTIGKSATLLQVYDEECMSRTRVFEWHKLFKVGWEDIEDDSRPGSSFHFKNVDKNIEKINNLICQYRRLSSGVDAETVQVEKDHH